MNATPPTPAPRNQWPRLLLAVPAAAVRALAEQLTHSLQVEDLHLPQSGLGLLSLRDSALNDAYFPGEIALSRAHVRVTAGDGTPVEGAAQLLDDRASLARAIAVIDAVLAGQLPGFAAALPLLQAGQERLDADKRVRQALLSTTRVDFSLIGTEQDDDHD
jgi:alpha-D-ribose 1-methylphosphonate 5-triphosphate synthase subunit PhnG